MLCFITNRHPCLPLSLHVKQTMFLVHLFFNEYIIIWIKTFRKRREIILYSLLSLSFQLAVLLWAIRKPKSEVKMKFSAKKQLLFERAKRQSLGWKKRRAQKMSIVCVFSWAKFSCLQPRVQQRMNSQNTRLANLCILLVCQTSFLKKTHLYYFNWAKKY